MASATVEIARQDVGAEPETPPTMPENLAEPEGQPAERENPLQRLSEEQIERLGEELDAIGEQVRGELGEGDARYIRGTIKLHRGLVAAARAVLVASGASRTPGRRRRRWLAGTAMLSVAKVLENMEIGHNVMHGQWDWMNDPYINSRTWDWDTASPAEAWRHSHNYEHHTYTNIRGLDRDLGYEIMRVDPQQKWYPLYLAQPLYNLVLMGFFEWGVALHDLNFEAIKKGEKPKQQAWQEVKAIGVKARRQVVKDYIAFPALSAAGAVGAELVLRERVGAAGRMRRLDSSAQTVSPAGRSRAVVRSAGAGRERASSARANVWSAFKQTLAADFSANIVRNVWAHSIIFCGHFPDQTYTFSQKETENETRGEWYVRQLLGSANIEGGDLFHFMAGNLSFQIEHHLYPDMPSNRYKQIAPRVREVCERYGLPYNTGPLSRQLGMVHRTILRLALPGGRPRPKPGP